MNMEKKDKNKPVREVYEVCLSVNIVKPYIDYKGL